MDLIALELSSFQLESIEAFRPRLAVILNITPNHGERYSTFEEYAKAKFRITQNMGPSDVLIYSDDLSPLLQGRSAGIKCYPFNRNDLEGPRACLEKNYDLTAFKLVGRHNLLNLSLATFALEVLLGKKVRRGVQRTIGHFFVVPHRLQRVDSPHPFTSFNDAKSTNWEATLTAIDSIEKEGRPLCLILGGQKRGCNDSSTPYISELSQKVDKVLLIGETAQQLGDEFHGLMDYVICGTLEKAIEYVKAWHWQDGILLFSPAFPSFDQFEDYRQRGQLFIDILGPPPHTG